MPKPNFYQSLHTTVMGEAGQPFEVQIRTREMDLIAERGIAAHWKYKEGKPRPARRRRAVPVAAAAASTGRARSPTRGSSSSSLKVDLYPDEVYTFTPKGEVFAFPRGATPLDFAYRDPHGRGPPLRRRAGQRQARRRCARRSRAATSSRS